MPETRLHWRAAHGHQPVGDGRRGRRVQRQDDGPAHHSQQPDQDQAQGRRGHRCR